MQCNMHNLDLMRFTSTVVLPARRGLLPFMAGDSSRNSTGACQTNKTIENKIATKSDPIARASKAANQSRIAAAAAIPRCTRTCTKHRKKCATWLWASMPLQGAGSHVRTVVRRRRRGWRRRSISALNERELCAYRHWQVVLSGWEPAIPEASHYVRVAATP